MKHGIKMTELECLLTGFGRGGSRKNKGFNCFRSYITGDLLRQLRLLLSFCGWCRLCGAKGNIWYRV